MTGTHVTQDAMAIGAPIRLVPLSSIRAEREPWHARRGYLESEVAQLARAIQASGTVEPLEVMERHCELVLVSGWLRLQAVISLANQGRHPGQVLVRMVPRRDSVALLEHSVLSNQNRFPLRTLELGWAMRTLETLLQQRGEDHGRQVIARRLCLTTPKSLLSEAYAAAAALPLAYAEDAERRLGVHTHRIATIPRASLRVLIQAQDDVRSVLRESLVECMADGQPPTRTLRTLRAQLQHPSVMEAAVRALASGQRVSAAVSTAEINQGQMAAASALLRRLTSSRLTKLTAALARLLRQFAAHLVALAAALSRTSTRPQ